MPPIAKPKKNVLIQAAEAIKAKSPLPGFVNDMILPTDMGADVTSIPAGGALEPAIGAGANLISPLVSLYKNKAQREAATKAFYDSVIDFAKRFMPGGSDNQWVKAAEDLITTHPRVAAHMRHAEAPAIGGSGLTNTGSFGAAMDWYPIASKQGPGELQLHTNSMDDVARSAGTARNYMKHEATHAAQALGDPWTPELYNIAHTIMGYDRNPYERSARFVGDTARGGFKSSAQVPPTTSVMQTRLSNQLKRMGISLDTIRRGGNSPASLTLRKWGAAKEPQNMVDINSLEPKLRDQLLELHRRLSGDLDVNSIPRIIGQSTNPGKATENMKQIIDARRTGVPGTTLEKAYQHLVKRTEK